MNQQYDPHHQGWSRLSDAIGMPIPTLASLERKEREEARRHLAGLKEVFQGGLRKGIGIGIGIGIVLGMLWASLQQSRAIEVGYLIKPKVEAETK